MCKNYRKKLPQNLIISFCTLTLSEKDFKFSEHIQKNTSLKKLLTKTSVTEKLDSSLQPKS